MDFEKLKAFYIVARHSSLKKGAEELGIPATKLENIITNFETDSKTVLFNKRDEMWSLTLQGHFLFRKARIILSEVESVRNVLEEREKETISGNLKIITTTGLGSLWLAQYVKGFLKTYPDLRLAIYPQDREVDIALGEGDVAIRPLIADGQNLIQHYLMTWHVGLYASRDYIKEFGMPQSVQDLDNHRIITLGYEQNTPYKDINWLLSIGKRPDEIQREPYLKFQALPALLDCTLEGLGIAALSKELPVIKQNRLVHILPEIKGPEVDIFFIYPKFMADSKKILAFRDYLIASIRQDIELREAAKTPIH